MSSSLKKRVVKEEIGSEEVANKKSKVVAAVSTGEAVFEIGTTTTLSFYI
jgi:hypothetical protein